MAALTLAVEYRPRTFSDVVEQASTVQILEKQIEEKTYKQAYLFSGPAGTGKTTIGRILGNEINGRQGNIIEVDAASNNSVENIRQIIADAQIRSFDSEFKVYIIDECHALSSPAWQAILKTLEEPPAKTIFIFCTTDPQKIPATILSRVQRYEISKISYGAIVARLSYILTSEKKKNAEINWTEDALKYIAKLADGGMRDAISMCDKCLSFNSNITLDVVVKALGTVNYATMFDLTNAVIDQNELGVIKIINDTYDAGNDLKQFMQQYALFLLDLVKYIKSNTFDYIKIPAIYKEQLDATVRGVDIKFFYNCMRSIISLNNNIKWDHNAKASIESELLLLCVGE